MFPRCSFALSLDESVLTAGTEHQATLVVTADRDIPRAERVTVAVQSIASAVVGADRSRRTLQATLWQEHFEFALPEGGLPAGTHRYVCALHVPKTLGPAFRGQDCERRHELWARLEVDWAVDPTKKFDLPIVAAPRRGKATSVVHRSAPDFSRDFVVDISLGSDLLVWGDTLVGEVAVRAAEAKTAKRFVLRLVSLDTIGIEGFHEVRRVARQEVQIPMVDLADERRVRFSIPIDERMPCTHLDGQIDNSVVLEYALEQSWTATSQGAVRLEVLPPGSELARPGTPMQSLRGHREVEDRFGAIRVTVADAPREGRVGAQVTFELPDVALGISLRELGLLDGFTTSPLLPSALAFRFHLRTDSQLDARHQRDFFAAALQELARVNELELDDSCLRYHQTLPSDAHFDVVRREADERAKRMVRSISAFPFSSAFAAQEEAWRVAAAQAGAFLLPHVPRIVGLTHVVRTQLGEPRIFPYTIQGHGDRVEVLLHLEALGGTFVAREDLQQSASLALLRQQVDLVWATPWNVSASASQHTFGPLEAVKAVETLAVWVMHARGEPLAASPYR